MGAAWVGAEAVTAGVAGDTGFAAGSNGRATGAAIPFDAETCTGAGLTTGLAIGCDGSESGAAGGVAATGLAATGPAATGLATAGLATTGVADETAGRTPGTATTAGLGGTAMTGLAPACAWSAWRRSRIARAMSPGFEAFEKSTRCFTSAAFADERVTLLRPPVRCPRTFSASSSSMDELWVFFSTTPTAVSASRILLLLTSSSRARSLILTLLNQSSS